MDVMDVDELSFPSFPDNLDIEEDMPLLVSSPPPPLMNVEHKPSILQVRPRILFGWSWELLAFFTVFPSLIAPKQIVFFLLHLTTGRRTGPLITWGGASAASMEHASGWTRYQLDRGRSGYLSRPGLGMYFIYRECVSTDWFTGPTDRRAGAR